MTNGRKQEGECTPNPGETKGEGFVRYIRQTVGDEKILQLIHDGARPQLTRIMKQALKELNFSPANAQSVAEAFGDNLHLIDGELQSEISMRRHMFNVALKIQRSLQCHIDR